MPSKKKPAERFTTHKPRSVWFAQRAAYPFRDASPDQLEQRMWIHPEAPPRWECLGPSNIAGRVTALAIHPDRGVLFAGTAAGGVWRSSDQGRTWQEPPVRLYLPDDQAEMAFGGFLAWPSGNIGALAIDPSNPDRVYCATGEANLSADSYPGVGLFYSNDGGERWLPLASAKEHSLPRRVGSLAVDPFDPMHMRLGGVTHSETDPAGMFYSRDGGRTWAVERLATRNYFCHSVAFHPGRRGVMFTAVDARGSLSGIWRSMDGGETWVNLSGAVRGLPEPFWFGRVSLAVAPSQPDVMYAMAGNRRGVLLGLFRSDDCGESWRDVKGGELADESQMSYTNTIAVHPVNPDFVVCGGLDLHISVEGEKRWRRATRWDEDADHPKYAHGDHHALAILPDGTIFDGNDGGIAVSTDGGGRWRTRVSGMVTTMFYDLDVAPTDSECMAGGTQDNGTVLRDRHDPRGVFHRVIPGDGAWTVYDPADEENVFGSYHEVHIFRHLRKGGGGWLKSGGGDWKEVTPRGMSAAERKQRAIAVMAIEPVRRPGVKAVWVGTNRLWKTENGGRMWKPVTAPFDGSAITAIEIAEDYPDFMLVGTTNGGVFRSVDAGKTWSPNVAGAEIPPRLISRFDCVAIKETGERRVIMTVAGSGVGKSLVERDVNGLLVDRGYSHVFVSKDDGCTWRDVDQGYLPDLAYHAAVYETQLPYRTFVGGDMGVFVMEETGDEFRWANITGNLPNVIVSDLVYHEADRVLTAATYGRGVWRLKLEDVPKL
jgi:photosystem II stability/assembly factor-like uncharacterized protein